MMSVSGWLKVSDRLRSAAPWFCRPTETRVHAEGPGTPCHDEAAGMRLGTRASVPPSTEVYVRRGVYAPFEVSIFMEIL
jgi:hypothetical protein